MAGLIDNEMNPAPDKVVPDPGTVAQAGSVGIDPDKRAVDAAKETVSGQLDKLLAADSPYIQRARAGAMSTANDRGLINSSMAAGAGEAAAIDRALPVANADATAYGTASRDNQVATNAALGVNADATNKATLVNTTAQNDAALQNLRGEQSKQLADIEASYKNLMQANSSASSMFTQTQNQIAQILGDPKTDAGQKASAVQSLTSLLQSGLTVVGAISNLNLTGLLSFNGGAVVNPV